MENNIWEKYSMTEEEWEALSESDREKITGQDWHKAPCSVCGKDVLLSGKVRKSMVFCMEHR